MIASGMAWHSQPYARELAPGRADMLIEAERGAKVHRAGVWGDLRSATALEFRRQQREAHSR